MKFPIGALLPVFRGLNNLLISGRVGGFPFQNVASQRGGGIFSPLSEGLSEELNLKAERNPDCSVKHETKGMAQNQQPQEYNIQ